MDTTSGITNDGVLMAGVLGIDVTLNKEMD